MGFQITIIGMNVTGSSIGLALGAFPGEITRIGVDREAETLNKAKRLGVVDGTSINIPDAVKDADVIVLAEPLDQLLDTLNAIIPCLNADIHLLDVSGVKQAINLHMLNSCPDFHNHVNLTCVVNPDYMQTSLSSIEDARQDLFKNGLIALSMMEGTSKDTVELASAIVRLLGARIMFTDPVEADGLQAAALYLPQLLSSMLMNAAAGQPGWREARKLVNAPFMLPAGSLEMIPNAKSAVSEWLAEKENLIRYIDILAEELQDIRSELETDAGQHLADRVRTAKESFRTLHDQRQSGDLVDTGQVKLHLPSSAETLREMIGFGRRKKSTE
jgi:prephenate dehydrogenase